MKTLYFLITLGATLLFGGCNSSTEPSVSPEIQAQQSAAALKAIPPQAQAGINQQAQQKAQTDAMRAKDAAKSAAP